MANAHVCVKPRHNHRIYPEFAKKQIQIRLEETAVTTFRDNVIPFAKVKFGDYFCPFCPRNRVITPEFKFVVNPLSILTEGVHIHTITVADDEAFARIKEQLASLNILIETT